MKKLAAIAVLASLSLSMLPGCGNESAASSKEATAENPMVLTLSHGLVKPIPYTLPWRNLPKR